MSTAIKLVGLILSLISLILGVQAFEDLGAMKDPGDGRLSAACSFREPMLGSMTSELIGWYIVLIISLIKPHTVLSFFASAAVLATGAYSMILGQLACGCIDQCASHPNGDLLRIVVTLNTLATMILGAHCLNQVMKKIPGFD